jgi:hypothetical protein
MKIGKEVFEKTFLEDAKRRALGDAYDKYKLKGIPGASVKLKSYGIIDNGIEAKVIVNDGKSEKVVTVIERAEVVTPK